MLPNQLRLIDGTIVRKDPVENIYSSERGDFYSPHKAILTDQGWIMRKLKAEISKRTAKSSHGGDYPKLRNYGNALCHTIIARTWIGSRPQGYEIDHLNGNILDWSADNLQYVTPDENSWRSRHVLQVLRGKGIDPATYTGPQMDKWFALFRAYEAANRPPIHIPTATILRDFDLFAFSDRFTLVNPDTLMSRDMSRHAEL